MKLFYKCCLVALVYSSSIAAAAASAPELGTTNVKVIELIPRKLTVSKSYIGHLKPQNRVIVKSETSGTVERIGFEEGQSVQAGDELVHVSTRELLLRKTMATADYDQALADYQLEKELHLRPPDSKDNNSAPVHIALQQLKLQAELARTDYEHTRQEHEVQQRLFVKKMITKSAYNTSRKNLDMKQIAWHLSELAVENARIADRVRLKKLGYALSVRRAQMRLASLELAKSKVKVPFSGIIRRRTVQMGGFIQRGTPLYEIMDISRVQVRIRIPEHQIRRVRLGMRVSIRLDALPGETFEGTVKTLGLEADINSRCFAADVLIDNSRQALLPGMMARVEMKIRSETNQIIVPRHAIIERQWGPVAFVVRDGKAAQVRVVTGVMVEEKIQVLQGLSVGDKLIVVGQDLLAHNEPVKVINPHQKIAKR